MKQLRKSCAVPWKRQCLSSSASSGVGIALHSRKEQVRLRSEDIEVSIGQKYKYAVVQGETEQGGGHRVRKWKDMKFP